MNTHISHTSVDERGQRRRPRRLRCARAPPRFRTRRIVIYITLLCLSVACSFASLAASSAALRHRQPSPALCQTTPSESAWPRRNEPIADDALSAPTAPILPSPVLPRTPAPAHHCICTRICIHIARHVSGMCLSARHPASIPTPALPLPVQPPPRVTDLSVRPPSDSRRLSTRASPPSRPARNPLANSGATRARHPLPPEARALAPSHAPTAPPETPSSAVLRSPLRMSPTVPCPTPIPPSSRPPSP